MLLEANRSKSFSFEIVLFSVFIISRIVFIVVTIINIIIPVEIAFRIFILNINII